MKEFFSTIVIIIALLFSGCKDEEKEIPSKTDFYTASSLIFWTPNSTHGNIYVDCDGETGTITTYSSTTPNCTASGFVTINKIPGSYYYYAYGSQGGSWSGTVVINLGCNKMKLE